MKNEKGVVVLAVMFIVLFEAAAAYIIGEKLAQHKAANADTHQSG